MKMRNGLACLALLLAMAASAGAQLVAGSPEDRLYTQITETTDPSQKIRLCLQFAEQFPNSRVLPSVYMMLADLYGTQNEPARAIEYGERAIALDGNNVDALMRVSLALATAISRQQIPADERDEARNKAIEYAQRAIDLAGAMRTQSPPPNYTAAQWEEYVNSTETAARNYRSYAENVR